MAEYLDAFKKDVRSKIYENTGIVGKVLAQREQDEEKEQKDAAKVAQIEEKTQRIQVGAESLTRTQQHLALAAKNLQNIAKLLGAEAELLPEAMVPPTEPAPTPVTKEGTTRSKPSAVDKEIEKESGNLFDMFDKIGKKKKPKTKRQPKKKQKPRRRPGQAKTKRPPKARPKPSAPKPSAGKPPAKPPVVKPTPKPPSAPSKIGKAAGEAAGKAKKMAKVGKAALKTLAKKAAAKSIAKIGVKSIPFVGAAAAAAFAIGRVIDGDLVGAGVEVVSGLGSAVTAIPAEIAQITRDLYYETYGVYPENDPDNGERFPELASAVKEAFHEAMNSKLDIKEQEKATKAYEDTNEFAGTDTTDYGGPPKTRSVSLWGRLFGSKSAEAPKPAPAKPEPAATQLSPPPPPPPATPAAKPDMTKAAPTTGLTLGGIKGMVLKVAQELGITNRYGQIALLANIEKESGFKPRSENLKYSTASRIKAVFPSKTKNLTPQQIEALVNNPPALANVVYGNKMGNTNPGDGWMFRGRGFIQITGRDNYRVFGKMIGEDLLTDPDKANDPTVAAKLAAAFMLKNDKNINKYTSQAEANRGVTQAIGGKGLNLDKGIGAEILAKVNKYSGSVVNDMSQDVQLAKHGQKQPSVTTNVIALNTVAPPVTTGKAPPRSDYVRPIA